jgi:peptidoglycan hydrolase CwlO-like protein
MKRLRLSTVMLLVVIASLVMALVVQHNRAARREAELQARLAQSWPLLVEKKQRDAQVEWLIKHVEDVSRQIHEATNQRPK